jgi:hypothetical protein
MTATEALNDAYPDYLLEMQKTMPKIMLELGTATITKLESSESELVIVWINRDNISPLPLAFWTEREARDWCHDRGFRVTTR